MATDLSVIKECIEQDNERERALAVQAMDFVYQYANTSIGLFNVQLQAKHLYSLMAEFQLKAGKLPPTDQGGHVTRLGNIPTIVVEDQSVREAAILVATDPWNTRAWILQEAFASSGNMILLFPRDKLGPLAIDKWELISGKKSQSEIAIRLERMQVCLQACIEAKPGVKKFENWYKAWGEGDLRNQDNTEEQELTSNPKDLPRIVEMLNWFHPPPLAGWLHDRSQAPELFSGGYTFKAKPRRTCSAAMAMPFLRVRDLWQPADKLAILANMCDYDLRLNTEALAETQTSLATCLVALSLANGDFSLLVPQLYPSLSLCGKSQSISCSYARRALLTTA